MLDFLKNLSINLKATGPAAVIIVWIMGVTALGLLGSGEIAKLAMYALVFAGGVILFGLAQKA